MKKLVAASLVVLVATTTFGQTKRASNPKALANEFQQPGNEARPRVWWHWMNGNISKAGIRNDLLWMHQAGIGGFQHFDAGLVTPQVVEKRLVYMTPEWKDAFLYTTKLADSLKLEMAIAGSPGWSESGGPWVQPKDGMKKYVWRELLVEGERHFRNLLPKPEATTGTFQNIPVREEMFSLTVKPPVPPQFYEDVAVVAYRLPATHVLSRQIVPKITSNAGNFTLSQLTDGDLATTTLLPVDSANGYAWIQFRFDHPQTIRAVTVVGGGDKGPFGLYGEKAQDRSLEASEDGVNFKHVAFIPAGDVLQQTISMPETTARYFRVTFKNPVALPNFGGGAPLKHLPERRWPNWYSTPMRSLTGLKRKRVLPLTAKNIR